MITSNTSPMPPVATPRKARTVVKPSKPPVIAGPPKPKFPPAKQSLPGKQPSYLKSFAKKK